MRLLIERNQHDMKSMFGRHKGVEFTLWFRLELTPEEEKLARHYGLDDHVLIWRDAEEQEPWITVADAKQGTSQTLPSINVVWRNEQKVRIACASYKTMLDIAKTFGGQDIVEL